MVMEQHNIHMTLLTCTLEMCMILLTNFKKKINKSFWHSAVLLKQQKGRNVLYEFKKSNLISPFY